MSLLVVNEIHVFYGQAEALFGLSMTADAAEITTVIGANGAGKTTLLSAIAGIRPVRGGTIVFDGVDISTLPVAARLEAGISLVPEKRELFADMSVEDNLVLGSYLPKARRGRYAMLERIFTLFPRLKERRHQVAGTLSGGERQMLALGRALMSRPRLLLLDEPSLGLAPKIVAQAMQIVRELREDGTSIVLVEQNARAALSIADRGYVLESGFVSLHGMAEDLLRDDRVAATYLGVGKPNGHGVEARAYP